MKYELRTQIDIPASPDEVWRHLIDFSAYDQWNPFITSAAGPAAVGSHLELRMEPPGGRAMTFRPTVTELSNGRVLEWLGRLVMPGLFDGRHRFELAATDSGTHLVQRESFGGMLIPLLRRSLDRSTRAGFEAMNKALCERVIGSRSR
jgi:hypothetical protein